VLAAMTDSLEFHRYLARETGSVERVRDQQADIEPRGTYSWWCRFEDGDNAHLVLLKPTDDGHEGTCLTLEDGDPAGRCKGHTFNDGPCAHLFAVWNHTLRYEQRAREIVDNLDVLGECQREVWLRVEHGDYGVREYARLTGRAPGTVGNLLASARDKLPAVTPDASTQRVRADGGRIEAPAAGADGREFGRPEAQR
jgi:hypothetical protein